MLPVSVVAAVVVATTGVRMRRLTYYQSFDRRLPCFKAPPKPLSDDRWMWTLASTFIEGPFHERKRLNALVVIPTTARNAACW